MKIRWCFLLSIFSASFTFADANQLSIERMDADSAAGKPLVAHIIVALCDNKYQGIVPVPAAIGNGDDPNNNLYWGALYGVKTYFKRSPDWQTISLPASENPKVLDRLLFQRSVNRKGKPTQVYVLAEAWRGREIAAATEMFLKITHGGAQQTLTAGDLALAVGSSAHLIAYVGHNGLMDFLPPNIERNTGDQQARSAVILACKSHDYFKNLVSSPTSLLLTTRSFMAPEAYSLEATISQWFTAEDVKASIDAATKAYAKYQKISERSARTVFVYPNLPSQTAP